MKNVLISFIIILCSFTKVNSNKNISHNPFIIKKIQIICIDKEICKDPFGLEKREDIILFLRYIKTQSKRLKTENGRRDVYFVMQAMLNRMRDKHCTWRQYYNNPKLNHSNSIKRMKNGSLSSPFSFDDKRDQELYRMLLDVKLERLTGDLKLPDNVLFFESYPKSPNRGVHVMKNFYIKARHKFYTK